MPPKNHIELSPGEIFFEGSAGRIPLQGIQEATLEPEEGAEAQPLIISADLANEASITVTIDDGFLNLYSEYWRKYREKLKTLRKLMHLGWHGKNRRIRKKNWRRAIYFYNTHFKGGATE